MNLFEYNLDVLVNSNTNDFILEDKEDKYEYIISENEIEWFLDKKDNKSYPIKDEFDNTQNPLNKLKRELVFIIGINSLKEIETLIANANANTAFVIYEPNINFLLHALRNKDLSIFREDNIILIAQPLEEFMPALHRLLSSRLILLTGNIKVYLTYFYRIYATHLAKKIVETLRLSVRTIRWSYGNSIDDCLEGSTQSFQNLRHIFHSKDVRKLKNAFSDVPTLIVSAGPSLEKNIKYLHQAQGKAVIIATETILSRLLQEGIIPHFVTTIERTQPSYEYGYKGKNFPKEVTLIAPGVIKPMIFNEYKGDIIIPMREGVREYTWWESLLELGEDSFVVMGDSTAHLAFGFAMHIGANPIVLIGQDLAFGELGTKCHASGTFYEDVGSNPYKDPMQEPDQEAEGYYGGIVKTSLLWISFKKWFELYTHHLKDKVTTINATEGGVKISGTVQMPLLEVIERYCTKNVDVLSVIRDCPQYPIDKKKVAKKLCIEIKYFNKVLNKAKKMYKVISKIKMIPDMSSQELLEAYEKLKSIKISDEILNIVYQHDLLGHNIQPEIVHTFYKLYKLEEVLTYENLKANIEIQKSFAEIFIFMLEELLKAIEKAYEEVVNPPVS